MSDKLLAEWFWTDRWMGSTGFLLPMEARGLYREMLTQAWRRGGRLPNDPVALQRATGATRAEWSRCWPKVAHFWRVEGDYIVNDTQLEVMASARLSSERASARGRAGAQALHKQRSSGAQAERKHQPPSPSPSPLTETNSRQVGERPIGNGSPAHLPPADRTETAIRKSVDGMRSRLYGLIDEMRELDPRGRDPTELMRFVTGYQKADGTMVKGVVNAALLTFERLEKSIEDAEANISDWKAEKK